LLASAREHDDRHALAALAQRAQQIEARHVGQAEVEDDQVRALRHKLERRLSVRRLEHLIALRAEPHTQELADRRLVVDYQDPQRRRVHAALSSFWPAAGTGSEIVNAAPARSVRFAAVTVPCIASTKPREIASPSPVPAR